ncbi:MAG TPA: spore coat protein [Oscillospiraceae bacterium]|nr:spore coat protein [Oscillospiraceae bacterium]HPF55124.1 spore coat protein [Clostridiales bacterium]HPK34558.1 spore coat protein [Oscillospiraceae bacterium]HPR74786.1 spore coat protein [Oscillospiraceae bacterium]
MMQLTQKETSLLKDLKDQEQVCVEKYAKYSSDAKDLQLKDLFSRISQNEQQHLDTVTQIMGGTVPQMQSGNGQQITLTFTPTYQSTPNTDQDKQNDSYICADALSTEKHVSSVYNTDLFEFRDTGIRDALNHIQKEEQQHGEQIYQYMAQNGLYGG